MMPRMQGTKAAAAMRELGFSGIIIGVTGHVLAEDREEFLRHGVDAVMSKPFEFDVFKSHLNVLKTSWS